VTAVIAEQRVAETTAITPKPEKRTNVRKFRKFPPFHEPVTEDQALSVRSYTKIVIKIPQKMLS
jgi:hypothetical protein